MNFTKSRKSLNLKDCFKSCTQANNSTFITNDSQITKPHSLIDSPIHFYQQRQDEIKFHQETYGNQTPLLKTHKTLKKQSAQLNLQSHFNKNEMNDVIEDSSVDISKFPLLIATPEKKRCTKLTSTQLDFDSIDYQQVECVKSPTFSQIIESKNFVDFEDIHNAYANYLYESPDFKKRDNSISKVNFLQNSSDFESHGFDSSDTLCNETIINFELISEENIYVCSASYEAMSDVELTIHFAERLKLIQHAPNSNLCLVQNIQTRRYGYVPKWCLNDLKTFLSDLKFVKNNF
jgi:hypothetical protein